MRIVILGGDGYLGWPTAMHLSAQGHDIAIADNYLRRDLMRNEDVEPLYSSLNLHDRVRLWQEHTSNEIQLFIGDLNQWDFMAKIFQEFQPEAIVHLRQKVKTLPSRHLGLSPLPAQYQCP